MKLIKSALIGALTIGGLAGCSLTAEPYTIPLTNLKAKTFTFKKFSAEGYEAVSKDDAIKAVSKYIEKNSAYNHCKSSLYGSSCSKRGKSGIVVSWGKNLHAKEHNFELIYFRSDRYSPKDIYKAELKQLLPYNVIESDNSVVIELLPPTEAKATPSSGAPVLEFNVGISNKNVVAWTNRLFTSKELASFDELVVDSGEFNVDLDPQSVKSNLIRKHQISFSDDSNGVQATASVDWRIDNSPINLDIIISLYRGKSKVEYKINQSFTLRSDGSVERFSPEAIKIAIETLKQAANA